MTHKTHLKSNLVQGGMPKSKRVIRSGVNEPRSSHRRVTKSDIQRVVDRIVQEMTPERVILFGSYAYGKPNQDSDVDLLVVMNSRERPNLRVARVLGAIYDVKNFPMDILVRTPAEIRKRIELRDPFIREILERGKILYELKSV